MEFKRKFDMIGFGGGCHWCTEAVFQSVVGVSHVEQGWIAPIGSNQFSEGALVHYDSLTVAIGIMVAIHLHSHSSTSNHSMREKYRSAVYVFDETQTNQVMTAMVHLQKDFSAPLVTQILEFRDFKLNSQEFLDYYKKDSERPFCKSYITPKLEMLADMFPGQITPVLKEKEINQ